MCRNALCTQVASCGDGGGEDGPLVSPWGARRVPSSTELQPAKFSGKQGGTRHQHVRRPLTFKFKSLISTSCVNVTSIDSCRVSKQLHIWTKHAIQWKSIDLGIPWMIMGTMKIMTMKMMTVKMMMTMMMMITILSVWLTLSQPGPQPDDPLDPPGKDALAPRHDDDEDDEDDYCYHYHYHHYHDLCWNGLTH